MTTMHVKLDCGDWTRANPDQHVGALVLCPLHCAYREVIQTQPYEWHVKCEECRWARWYGQSEGDARRAQRLHRQRHGHLNIGCSYDRVTPDGRGTIFNWL